MAKRLRTLANRTETLANGSLPKRPDTAVVRGVRVVAIVREVAVARVISVVRVVCVITVVV